MPGLYSKMLKAFNKLTDDTDIMVHLNMMNPYIEIPSFTNLLHIQAAKNKSDDVSHTFNSPHCGQFYLQRTIGPLGVTEE